MSILCQIVHKSGFRKAVDAPRLLRRFLATERPQVAKRYEAASGLVPQREPHAREASPQGEAADLGKLRMIAQRHWQSIERNSAAQVMHVVHADIRGEPAQNTGQ